MEKLVVCYSRSGNTMRAAKLLATELGARLVEIKEKNPRRGLIGFITSGMYSTFGWPSEILPVDMPAEKPAVTVVCGPIWAGKMSSPVRAFLMQNKDKMGAVAYILTRGDRQNEYRAVFEQMDAILGHGSIGGLSVPAEIADFELAKAVSVLAKGL